MRLSVVIPTHQRPEALRELLHSLADQEFAMESVEVLVVSNFHEDGSQSVVENIRHLFPTIEWLAVGEKGVNRARNLGLRRARGEIALFLDDDCFISHRYYLNDILSAHEEHPQAAAIGGAYFTQPGAPAAEKAYNHVSATWLARRSEESGKYINLVGGNVSYKREVLKRREMYFNDEIVFGGAETDLHLRIYRAGEDLIFLENLSVEHRPRLTKAQLLRKGFLQGLAAHLRWQQGLFVATRKGDASPHATLLPSARFWASAFDLSFRLGGEFGRWSGQAKPNMSLVPWFLIIQFFQTFLQRVRDGIKRWAFMKSFLSGERRLRVGLPISRFYFLEVAGETNSSALGLKAHLKRAKTYGFRDVLLPCQIFFLKNRHEIVDEILEIGLRPFLLVNGDHRASMPLQYLEEFSANCEFHLLLGPPSDYQNALLDYFRVRGHDISATYLHKEWREGVEIIKNLPSNLAHRTHFLFPAQGDLWHPHPSCVEIQKFLQKLLKVRSRKAADLFIRGPAGYWPVDRGAHAQREPWPLITPTLVIGEASRSVQYSVIIPTFDSGPHLVKMLRALNAQTVSPKQFEVIIVDDGSRDGTESLLRDFLLNDLKPKFHFRYLYWPRPSDNLTFRAGLTRNLGVSQSVGTYLCFLDSDILVPPNYLEDLGRAFLENDVIQARREMLSQESSRACMSYEKFNPQDIYRDSDYWENFKSTEVWSQLYHHWKYTCTYALSLRRDLFLRAGWFSPEFFSYGFEDVDMGYRCARAGARFHLSQNSVYHLYPERSELSYHFDEKERTRALTLSSRVLYRNRLDPQIFNEFYPAYFQPLSGELKILASQAGHFIRWRILNEVQSALVRSFWWTWAWIIVPLLKPYYFVRYQIQKRGPQVRAVSAEVSGGS